MLKTDSPLSPELVLNIRVIGNRKPPFMQQASGDLNFEAESLTSEVREVHAFTVELLGSSPTPPVVRTESQLLKIGPSKLSDEQAIASTGAINRHYVYELTFATEPPDGRFSDEVVVIDPWESAHQQRLRVHGTIQSSIRVAPSRVMIQIGTAGNDRGISKQVLITSKESVSDLVVETDQKEGSPLVLGEVKIAEDGRRASFSVGLAPGISSVGDHRILIGRSSSPDRVIVPVAVRVEGAR